MIGLPKGGKNTMRQMMKSAGAAVQRTPRGRGVAAAALVAVGIAVLLALSAFPPKALAQLRAKPEASNQIQAVQISATIYGSFDYNFEGTGAWVGHALVSFADKPAKVATFADRNTSFNQRKNGTIYGTETISLRFTDGSGTFDIPARFEGTPGATPGLYALQEVGSIANGTGKYSQASGYVTVHGPFLFPDPAITAGAPPWIAEIHGIIFGVDER
jgi:hypothetical protein